MAAPALARPDRADFFDAAEGTRYDAAYDGRSPAGHVLRSRLGAVLERVGSDVGDVLDVGMGPGRLCAELASRGFRVTGIDSSPDMVALARRRLPQCGDRLLRSRVERLPFADDEFDVVVASGVLEYVDDRAAVVHELARVMRPGGRAVMTLPNVRSPYLIWNRAAYAPAIRFVKRFVRTAQAAPAHRRRPPSAARFKQMIAAAGLELEGVDYAAYLVPPAPLDELFPRMTVRIAERLAGSGPRVGAALATQLVFAARKEVL